MAASADLLRLRAGDPQPAVDRGMTDFAALQRSARFHLWNTYETCPAELYLLLGKDDQAYDDVWKAVLESVLTSLGYVCVVTEAPFLDEPLVEWTRVSTFAPPGSPMVMAEPFAAVDLRIAALDARALMD